MVAKKEIKNNSSKISPKTENGVGRNKDNTMAVLTHLLGIFVGFLGPLIVLLVTKETTVKNHARKALNWQLTYLLISIILFGIIFAGAFGSMLLAIINPLFMIIYFLSFILMIPLMALGLVNLGFCIIAAVKANEGTLWDYPFSLPILKTE